MTMPLVELPVDWKRKACDCLIAGQYSEAAQLYTQAIEFDPDCLSHYWYYGLLLLLQKQEAEAQTTWLYALSNCDNPDVHINDLVEILRTEADRQASLGEHLMAWAIRQHIREFCPDNIENLLHLLLLSIELEFFNAETFDQLGIVDRLNELQVPLKPELLLPGLTRVLEVPVPSEQLLAFIKACFTTVEQTDALLPPIIRAVHLLYNELEKSFAAELLELCLKFRPNQPEFLADLACLYQDNHDYDRGIKVAQHRMQVVSSLIEKIFSSHICIRGLLGAGGRWHESLDQAQQHENLLKALIEQSPSDLNLDQLQRLLNASYYLVYFYDDPKRWRTLQNQLLTFAQKEIQRHSQERVNYYQSRHRHRKAHDRLKIGYFSHCMNSHSVGFLARSLLLHHDRDQFELYGYFLGYREKFDPMQDWYVDHLEHVRKFALMTEAQVADQIVEDEIDILIDLDSITLDFSCHVLALKPAPVQVTWLGWDASGLPSIDYFIADPYVLPEVADSYYSEKIWRLPQSYIAVDGFEVDAPTLRREDLGIPDDAIVFLSAQRGYKRHIDTARLQLQILKQVPDSYFLIKGFSDQAATQEFFLQLADELEIDRDRLRFLKPDPAVPTHRANLAIADVVLDTFPYNGATTTLETLWREIPIVTRVGEQFAARNSYTMLMNAGVTEGIAFSDREYIEWGVRLGTDAALRQSVIAKLHQSKRSAPLWNGRQFAREMETAYQKMWEIHTQS